MNKPNSEILAALERGEIDAKEAVRQLEGNPPTTDQPESDDFSPPQHWPYLWTVPVGLGIVGLFGGCGLATLGGRWWLLAGPLLVAAGLLFVLGLASIQSAWVHIRIQSEAARSVSEFGLSLPLPLRPMIWLLQSFGGYVPALERTAVDELLVAMELTRQSDGPIFIDVKEEESGERVRVYFG